MKRKIEIVEKGTLLGKNKQKRRCRGGQFSKKKKQLIEKDNINEDLGQKKSII